MRLRMGYKKSIKIRNVFTLFYECEKSVLGATMSEQVPNSIRGMKVPETEEEKKKQIERNKIMFPESVEDNLIEELMGGAFENYLSSTRKGHANGYTPIKIWGCFKKFAVSKLPSNRLVTTMKIATVTGLTPELIRRHIIHFVQAGIVDQHTVGIKGNRKQVTYTVKELSEWSEDLKLDMTNHIMILQANDYDGS